MSLTTVSVSDVGGHMTNVNDILTLMPNFPDDQRTAAATSMGTAVGAE